MTVCAACKAPVVWALTETTRRPVALDAALTSDGTIATYLHGDHVIAVQVPADDRLAGVKLYRRHDCPFAETMA